MTGVRSVDVASSSMGGPPTTRRLPDVKPGTKKRNRTGEATYRCLRPGEPLPPGEPRRYLSTYGYILLRWRVGPGEYVEIREHRLVAGNPAGLEVHHRNHVKHDNEPDNLEALGKREHARRHGSDRLPDPAVEARRERERAARAARREAHEAYWARIADLYREGMSTVEIGRRVGVHSTNIYRGLALRGIKMRTVADVQSARIAPIRPLIEQALRDDVLSHRQISAHFGVGRMSVRRIHREMGLPQPKVGRRKAS